jgi:carboxymethylenebutenolidase
LAFYGEKDENLIKQLPELEQAMKEKGKEFEAKVYPNAGHAFFNDTNVKMYNQAAAEDSWLKMLVFLKKNLA